MKRVHTLLGVIHRPGDFDVFAELLAFEGQAGIGQLQRLRMNRQGTGRDGESKQAFTE